MSRPLRIEYAGAWYHVMNRGRRFEKVFEDRQDYRISRDTLKEIGRQFKIEKYSSVSSVIERVKRQMHDDAGFRKRIDELSSMLTKSQRQT